jgi:hypothetical protein
VDVKSGGSGLPASETDLMDDLLLEIRSKVVLSTEEDNATLRYYTVSVFLSNGGDRDVLMRASSLRSSSELGA